MNDANAIIEQLLQTNTDSERKTLFEGFEQLPGAARRAVEPRLVQLLTKEQLEDVIRSWIPSFLALTGTPGARQVLMRQLTVERVDLVRRWIVKCLVRYFTDDESIALIIQELQREQITHTRRIMVRMLGQSGNAVAVPKLIELLDDDDDYIRSQAALGLGQAQQREAVQPLIQRLAVEEMPAVSQDMIEALVTIGDRQAAPALVSLLRDDREPAQLHMMAAQALGQLATPEDENVIQALLEASCRSDRVIAITATDALLKLLDRDAAAQRVADFGLQHTDMAALPRVADALRLIGGMVAIEQLRAVRGDPAQEARAQTLLEHIGGRQALDVLIERRLSALTQASDRVQQFDVQALSIFQDTIREAKRGFVISLGMSAIIFAIGVVLLGVSIYIITRPNPTVYQQLFGIGGGLSGLGTILIMFYRGPLERIERAVTNLVQIEIAFLGYIRQVTQITAMFEREYLDDKNFSISDLKKLLDYIERTQKETMPLVNQYTLSPSLEKVRGGKGSQG